MRSADLPSSLLIRPMVAADLVAAHRLSSALQWPHRREDWQFMLRLGQGLVAAVEGEVVGTALAFRYGEAGATLGMIIVDAASQGCGIGRRLTTAIMAPFADRRLLLNATVEGEPLYRSLGFAPLGGVHQHQGAAFAVGLSPLRAGERIRPLGRADMPRLVALDRAAFGLSRDALLAALLEESEGVVLDRDGVAVGFAMVRRFGRSHVIGPVVAPDLQGAKHLIGHWLGYHQGIFLRVDVPADSGLSAWLTGLGLQQVGAVVTMGRGTAPPTEDGEVLRYGLVSQAFG